MIWILRTVYYFIIVIACEVAKPTHLSRFRQLSSPGGRACLRILLSFLLLRVQFKRAELGSSVDSSVICVFPNEHIDNFLHVTGDRVGGHFYLFPSWVGPLPIQCIIRI